MLVASITIVAVCSLIGLVGRGRWAIVVRPGGATFDDRVLPWFFLAFLVAALLSWRWPRVGGIVGAFVVAVFVPFAVAQLVPWSAALTIVVFGVPVLIWLVLGSMSRDDPSEADRRSEPAADEGDENDTVDQNDTVDLGRRRVLFTFAGAAVAVVAGSSLGRYVYDRIWGPTHPESEVTAPPESIVEWMWCGAVTTTGCSVRVRPRVEFENAALLVSTDAGLAGATPTPLADLYDRVADFAVDGLELDTRYWYALEVDGEVDRTRIGTFRTFPDRARPLRLAFGSCARTGSNGAVFDAIRAAQPDVYVNLGDFHYGDIFVDDVDDYRQVFDVQLTRPAQAALYRSVPIAYVWDDHDFGPDNADRTAPGRNAAMVAYREYVPHYELAGPTSAIFQAFTIGTTRVVMTDARSERDPDTDPDTGRKTMLGDVQLRWLLAELERAATDHDLVIWVNPVPWVDPAEAGADSWAGYDAERRRIAEHIAELGIDHLVMVSGDAHMVAIDDGTHTNYSTVDGAGFPLLHVASLDRPGSTKGGPYTTGPITGGGHFGLVEVDVTEAGTAVGLVAKDWRGDELLRHDVTLPRPSRRP